jgi:hypothetical protein
MATCKNPPKHPLQSKPETMKTGSNLLLLFTSGREKRRSHIFDRAAATPSPTVHGRNRASRRTRRHFMYNAIPLILAALIAVAIIVIGCFYIASPERISGTFGLKPPASDADTRAWLRPKGIRDVAAGLILLTMMLIADRRLVGIALLVFAIIPFGDMSIILGSGGSKSRAFSIHGVTCAVMLVVGLLLIHAI